ncbi:hypothetical protein ABB02_00776 [Clostridiaceae bacterium JG1575]|nr:hypothetical protein ABB02_00776 [Clostridiaceae bacterium JG1575]
MQFTLWEKMGALSAEVLGSSSLNCSLQNPMPLSLPWHRSSWISAKTKAPLLPFIFLSQALGCLDQKVTSPRMTPGTRI